EFADAFATGSSIMPQKKNPDVAELIRGKSGHLYGNLVAVLTTMKGLPLAYNADMQEDKEPFFDSVDTLEAILGVLPPLLAALTFRTDRMRRAAGEHFSTATDLADYLVKKGVPFRQAHEVVGRLVRYALDEGKTLEDLTLPELRRFSPLIDGDVKDAITVEASIRARAVTGGTAPAAVRVAGPRVTVVDDRDLAYGRRYTYVVVTADARRRTSPPSRRVSVTYLAAPEPPVSVTARPGEREARLAWQPPARLVDGSPATGPLAYEVLRAAAADAELTPVATAAPGQLTFTDHGLENER